MEDLVKKYPALEFPIKTLKDLERLCLTGCAFWFSPGGVRWKPVLYESYKANISAIGLDPEEYDMCIKYFCDTMKY